jgi:alpha-1,6-mannosyltransferase
VRHPAAFTASSQPGREALTSIRSLGATIGVVDRAVAHERPRRKRLVVADVALFYGERSGGVRTYLDERARFAAATGAIDHHMLVPGRRERHAGGVHELRALRLVSSNGYRVPLGAGPAKETLRRIRPDVVVLHDPFWRPQGLAREAHRLGARVVAVHHASAAHHAAGVPGPDSIYLPLFRRVIRHAYEDVDAVMSVIDPTPDSRRSASIPLRFGLHPAFRPGPAPPGKHLLYVGRLGYEKRVRDLLDAAAGIPDRPIVIVGDGPAKRELEVRAKRSELRGRVTFRPFITDRAELARTYRAAACVVDPGPHETFGLVVLEAAACGARVVACSSTPSAVVAGGLVRTFRAEDVRDLRRVIGEALDAERDVPAASELAMALRWEQVLADELEHLERLAGGEASRPVA